ncbi:MAG: gliding motility-associated C-terminal domain-containing protein [Bacteroidales bacterium]
MFLDPGNQFDSYLWQDNTTLPFFTVVSPGNYSVTVTNDNCPAFDDIFVNITSPEIDLGNDTLLCLGDTIYLDPGQGYSSYLWQDNFSGPVYEVVEEGNYSVLVTDNYNCISQASVEIASLAKPIADLGEDNQICEGETRILETPQGPYSYTWNGEPGDHYLEVQNGGTYTVEVSNQCGIASDQAIVIEFPVPEVDLGADQVIQPGETIQLDGGAGFDQYTWQDGAGGQYYVVVAEQIDPENPYYWVEVWQGPCKSSDTARIEMLEVKVPIVITPNGDGFNDVFSPFEDSWSGINRNHILIFNRWGEKVWESDNFEMGWDGKRNGSPVADGTYYWVLDVYYGEDDISQTIKGSVTVLNAEN